MNKFVKGLSNLVGTGDRDVKPSNVSDIEEYLQIAVPEFESRWEKPMQNNATLDDFKLMRTLGTGGFGRVRLVQHLTDKEFYAMKILIKDNIVKGKQVEQSLGEKKILQAINFPLLVRLFYVFKDNCNLFMVMEFVAGGEMFTYLAMDGKFTEERCRTYAAQVVLAFEYLHAVQIVYRDLKPENILIDEEGYIKITDLGLAKRVMGRTYTLCGTPVYLAPEVILNKGYGHSVDWWTLGILIYELIAGFPPFQGSEHMSIFEMIYAGVFSFPDNFSVDLKDICRRLIQPDLSKRFGNLRNGVEDIKKHSWFKTINWAAIFEKKEVQKFRPHVGGPGDDSNFDEFEDEPIHTCQNDRHRKLFEDF